MTQQDEEMVTPRLMAEAEAAVARAARKRTLYRLEAVAMIAGFALALSLIVIEDPVVQRLLAAIGLVVSTGGGLCAVDLISGRHDRFYGGMLASAWIGILCIFMLAITHTG